MKTKPVTKKVYFGLIELEGNQPKHRIAVIFTPSGKPRWQAVKIEGGQPAVNEVYRKFPGSSISYTGRTIEASQALHLSPETLKELMKSIRLKAFERLRGEEPTDEEALALIRNVDIEDELLRQKVNQTFAVTGEEI